MKNRFLIIAIIVIAIIIILASLLAADQYYFSLQDKELKESDWVRNCIPVGDDVPVPSIGLFNHTHSFDLRTCSWNPTEHGTSGFLESLYVSFVEPVFSDIAGSLEIKNAYASCAAEIDYDLTLEESELAFTGTVTRLDNYDGPQKVTFFIHEVIKGDIDTPKYILENSGLIFLENGSIGSSSVSVDYKIGKTYKVYVENGETNQCTTKLTIPPADYMWESGPEDGNYYSANSAYVDPCNEGYGLSDGICITLEEMNKDLPTCSANPRHDFGKCKKNIEELPNTFEQVKERCDNGSKDVFLEWWDDDVYYNNEECNMLERDNSSPLPTDTEHGDGGFVDPECQEGHIRVDGICKLKLTKPLASQYSTEEFDEMCKNNPALCQRDVRPGPNFPTSGNSSEGVILAFLTVGIGVTFILGIIYWWKKTK